MTSPHHDAINPPELSPIMERLLVERALERPPLIWSPFEDGETRGYTPIPVRGDPESPFGIVVHTGEYSWEERTGIP